MKQLWFSPCSVEQEGSENPASWLDDMLGDTLLNCFDRCAANVTIKNLSLLKYTSGSQSVKYRCSVQYVCCVRTVWFSLRVCVCDTDCCSVFPLSVTVACWGMSDLYSALFTRLEMRLSHLLYFSSICHLQDARVGQRSPIYLLSSFHPNWDFFTRKTFSSTYEYSQYKGATTDNGFFVKILFKIKAIFTGQWVV